MYACYENTSSTYMFNLQLFTTVLTCASILQISGPKSKKGQMSALESMFTAKPSSSKAEKGKSEKPRDANDAGHEEVSPNLNRLTMIDTDRCTCMALHKLGDGVGGLSYKIGIHNNQNF